MYGSLRGISSACWWRLTEQHVCRLARAADASGRQQEAKSLRRITPLVVVSATERIRQEPIIGVVVVVVVSAKALAPDKASLAEVWNSSLRLKGCIQIYWKHSAGHVCFAAKGQKQTSKEA